MIKVNRLEVIGDQGRLLVIWVPESFEVVQDLQDGGKTLKVFLTGDAQKHSDARRKSLFRDGQGRD